MLTDQQITEYNRDGYLILRDVLSADEADEMRKLVIRETPRIGYPPKLKYPAPGKYTISGNNIAEPGFAPIAEHPTVVSAVEDLLGEPAHLTAYVAYLRSAGDKGSGAHSDYKRWRPVGSSMNWLFTIIPLTDFNDDYGPLLVSPGSHLLSDVVDREARIWDVPRPDAKRLADFIDPELKAGDVLLMHGHTWHKAPAGTTSDDRCGVFNKYCGVSAPPAAGYYPYSQAAVDAMSDEGKRLIPFSVDKPISTTRVLIEDASNGEPRFLLARDGEGWDLPGGEGWEEEEDVGWDVGARVGSAQELARDQLDFDLPWASYINDAQEGDGLCRFYGYVASDSDPVSVAGPDREWLTVSEIDASLGESSPISAAVREWCRNDVVRGKGKAVSQRKQQFE